MNNYIGKVCPFCKTEIKEGDDIVVCSNCDMPHHKECWVENQGCTTFGCLGTIKAVDNGASSVTATEVSFEETVSPAHVFCTKCGTKMSASSAFCSKCGNPLKSVSSAPVYTQANPANTNPYQYTQQNYNPQPTYSQPAYQQQNGFGVNNIAFDQDVVALIGTKHEYYLPKFQEMKTQNKKATWNWAAFFFAPYWFIYRKMYAYGAAALVVAFLIALIKVPVISFVSLGGYIAIGVLANNIYMQWLSNKADQAKTMSEPFKTQYLQENSGVNTVVTILTVIIFAILVGIINAA